MQDDDETQAFHNFHGRWFAAAKCLIAFSLTDSFNCYPVDMDVISWLGVWYVKSELYEDAIQVRLRIFI